MASTLLQFYGFQGEGEGGGGRGRGNGHIYLICAERLHDLKRMKNMNPFLTRLILQWRTWGEQPTDGNSMGSKFWRTHQYYMTILACQKHRVRKILKEKFTQNRISGFNPKEKRHPLSSFRLLLNFSSPKEYLCKEKDTSIGGFHTKWRDRIMLFSFLFFSFLLRRQKWRDRIIWCKKIIITFH